MSTSALPQPPVTPIRTTLPLVFVPPAACPPRGLKNPRKRAPPSPLDGNFSAQRREYLFTLSTASNRRLLSPSTPTAPLLPPAPIFMPLPPTPSSASASTSSPTPLESAPMRRSPAMQTLCRFTASAFREERKRESSTSTIGSFSDLDRDDDVDESSTEDHPFRRSDGASLFDFYRSSSSSAHSSPELASDEGRWSDAPSDEEDSCVVFARRISFDSATPSPQSASSSSARQHHHGVPDINAFPVTPRAPVSHAEHYDSPSSPVPSLSYSITSSPSSASDSSRHSSPASSMVSLSSSPPSSPTPSSHSPLSSCISTFASTSFFSTASPLLSSTSSLAQRRLESLQKRRADKDRQDTLRPASRDVVIAGEQEVFGLGLLA